jgi:crotonobetaine/carnitine-CoA ligase
LRARGVGRGDRVLVFLPNGAEWLRAWWGTAALGAVLVPVNLAYRGEMLRHVCRQSDPRLIVTDPSLAERLVEVGPTIPVLYAAELGSGPADLAPVLDRPLEVWDTHAVMFTSGTTGPSKGSITSYLQTYMTGWWFGEGAALTDEDVWLIDLPLFHQAAQAATVAALAAGSRLAVRSAPALGRYWEAAKETGATIALGVSTMAAYLLAQPPSRADLDNPIRQMAMSPLPPDPDAFCTRFGIERLLTAYGSTEISAALVHPAGAPIVPGSCGRPRPGVEVRLVDDHDMPVGPDEVGELIVRSEPWELSGGYIGQPEATIAAWRNGWFHSGDALRVDADGNYFFHDRYKDAIRRRGENISSFEVEREVLAHPTVAEACCVAVPETLGVDEEVKVWVVVAAGAEFDPVGLVKFLAARMPHFMVPRYVEVTAELPKTETMRVRKHLLRETGNGPATWDRETAGIRITRDGLVQAQA